MQRVYSLYEAKAKFSEIIRLVQGGRKVAISYRGKVVAAVVPADSAESESLAARVSALQSEGRLSRATGPGPRLEPLASRPGALARFLAERE